MELPLPLSFREIVDEIVRFTDLPHEDVEHRVWMEALMTGYNVVKQARAFGVTPNRYDEKMAQLYREGDGFIFETLTFWSSPVRLLWIQQALQRIQAYASRKGLEPEQVRILIFGDGSGNDSLFLIANGWMVHYFDVPGSKTFEFASKRFEHYGLGDRLAMVTDYDACRSSQYDVVLSFEVLEHLSDPVGAIRDLAGMVKPDGIALITESFGVVSGNLPTHLASNLKHDGATPFLFLKHGMVLSYMSQATPFKPMEFTKVGAVSPGDRWRLLRDKTVMQKYLVSKVNHLGGA